MLVKNKIGLYESTLLEGIPNFIHGISTKAYGDMRSTQALHKLELKMGKIQLSIQTHSNSVHVFSIQPEKFFIKADAMVLQNGNRVDRESYFVRQIGVLTADCIPILFYDPKNSLVAIGHAGWKGTASGISKNIIQQMVLLGAEPNRILVAYGPYIHSCCYTVTQERALQFQSIFKKNDGVVLKNLTTWNIDLGKANTYQLISCGVRSDHIDHTSICTSCYGNEFYSFRKDDARAFGEMVTFIGHAA